MKKKVNIIKHVTLNQFPDSMQQYGQDYLSVFKVDFSSSEEDITRSLLKDSFRSDFFAVIKVISGVMVMRVDFNTIEVDRNKLFVSSPNTIKQVVSVSDDCVMEGISFTSDFLQNIKMPENIVEQMEYFSSKHAPLWQLNEEESELLSQTLKNIETRREKQHRHTFGREMLANSFYDFLYEIAEIGKNKDTQVGLNYNRKEDIMFKFSKLAFEHHLTERRLSFYSKALFLSTKHLSETVKVMTGKTAGQLIDELNAVEARRLLEDTDLSISEIAYHLHFSNPAFFSKFFARLTGKSPRAYRASFNKSSL